MILANFDNSPKRYSIYVTTKNSFARLNVLYMDIEEVKKTIKNLITKGNYIYNKYGKFTYVSIIDIYNDKTIAEQIEENKVRIKTIKEPLEAIKRCIQIIKK